MPSSSESIQQQVHEHRYEIDTIKSTMERVLISLDNNTSAQQAMTTQFAVYVSKHDATTSQLESVVKKIDAHSQDISAMKPVVDGVRGLIWKIVFSSIAGGSVVAGIAALLVK